MKHGAPFIALLAALSMMGALSIDAYLPALPAIATSFSVSPAAAQQTLTVYLFAFAFMTLFYGTLSDSFGRRPVILISLVLYLGSSVGASFANSLGMLILFRTCQGLSAGAGSVVGRAIVGDLLTGAEAQRTMSYISVVFGIAPAVAPVLGGWLQAGFGWRSIFWFIAGFSALLLIACALWLEESLPAEQRHPFHPRPILANYWEAARHSQFLFRCLGIAFSFSGILIYIGGAPSFVLGILHLTVTQFAWLFIPLIGGMTLGSSVAGRISHRYCPETTIRAGYTFMAVSALANLGYTHAFVSAIPWAIIPLFSYAFGMSLAMPAMNVLTLELLPKMRGMASSLQAFVFMTIFAVGSGLICPLLFGSAFKLAAGVACGLALSVGFWWLGGRGAGEGEVAEALPAREVAGV